MARSRSPLAVLIWGLIVLGLLPSGAAHGLLHAGWAHSGSPGPVGGAEDSGEATLAGPIEFSHCPSCFTLPGVTGEAPRLRLLDDAGLRAETRPTAEPHTACCDERRRPRGPPEIP